MSHIIHDIGVAKQIGMYGDAVETASGLRWLMTSGTPGFEKADSVSDKIEEQSELAWKNIAALLAAANMAMADIVKVTQYLTRAEDIEAYAQVRNRFLGNTKPASMLLVVPQLVWPKLLVEVEIVAARI